MLMKVVVFMKKISMDSFDQLHHIMHILIVGTMTDVFSQNVMRCDIDKKTLLLDLHSIVRVLHAQSVSSLSRKLSQGIQDGLLYVGR